MNISELARILRINPNLLRGYLPRLGFDVGQKAIKIDGNTAQRIIRNWSDLRRQMEEQEAREQEKAQKERIAATIKGSIAVPRLVSVKQFAALAHVPVNIILGQLMKNGVFASINENIDYDTAWLLGTELGVEVKPAAETDESAAAPAEDQLKLALAAEGTDKMVVRAPVIVVMGHVDHGKTKLLDAIRRTNVVATEAGGITQHIGAYQVERRGRPITFIDTPGHEAFTAMRSRGAKIADIAILVVAADDGVKPQTVEAYRIIEAAKIPFVVAINKVDKEGANLDKTKQELSGQLGITPEDWGGKAVCVPVSALKGDGIIELLDLVLLQADAEADHMKANPDANAIGTIVESHVDKGAGPVATLLVQNGTLHASDPLTLNGVFVGKARRLNDWRGDIIDAAPPSTPVQIVGLKAQPAVGDIIAVGEGERVKSKRMQSLSSTPHAAVTVAEEDEEHVKKLPVIVKSDVLGSGEAIEESLEKINTKTVKIKVLHRGLGNVSDGDIKRAEAAGATILGFNIKVPPAMEELARERRVAIKLYSIIYDLINDMKAAIEAALEPELVRTDLGTVQVLKVFRTDKGKQILGGRIASGRLEAGVSVEVVRSGQTVGKGAVMKIRSGKQDVSSASAGEECGIEYESRTPVKESDILNAYKEEKVYKRA